MAQISSRENKVIYSIENRKMHVCENCESILPHDDICLQLITTLHFKTVSL